MGSAYRTKLRIVEGKSLEDEHDNRAVAIWVAKNGVVNVQVGNGGDFGSTDWYLEPKDALVLANALRVFAAKASGEIR